MKYFFDNRYILWFVSLPSRECGLKLSIHKRNLWNKASLPSRECGLKFMKDDAKKEEPEVTPFAGVWIEIMMLPDPLGGMGSLPSRECGLKCNLYITIGYQIMSLPSRECGLKFAAYLDQHGAELSLPSRECGLKSFKCTSFEQFRLVTPFAGVWIEIQNMKLEHRQKISLSS